jgi:DNA replication protein DnaC
MTDPIAFNPFRDNVVQDAWQSPTDVAEIHDDVFRACLVGIESAARGVPDSLLIYGPAGSGKTHLLTRVQRHLAETAAAAPDRVLHCIFVFVRLQTSPS